MDCLCAGCGSLAVSRGYCDKHYRRLLKYGSPDGGAHGGKRNHDTTEGRFWRHVDRLGEDECWLWMGARLPKGYGQFSEGGREGKKLTAHRYSCILHHGPPPLARTYALHSCDNPPCVNPKHLRWGTQSANLQEAYDKGRKVRAGPVGEEVQNAVLTEERVRFIRDNASMGAGKLARLMGLKRGVVYAAMTGMSWRHVK